MGGRWWRPVAVLLLLAVTLALLVGGVFLIGLAGFSETMGWPHPSAALCLGVGIPVLLVVLVTGLWSAAKVSAGGSGRGRPRFTPAPDAAPAPAVFVPCPGCGQSINREAGRCPYCQTALGHGFAATPVS